MRENVKELSNKQKAKKHARALDRVSIPITKLHRVISDVCRTSLYQS